MRRQGVTTGSLVSGNLMAFEQAMCKATMELAENPASGKRMTQLLMYMLHTIGIALGSKNVNMLTWDRAYAGRCSMQ